MRDSLFCNVQLVRVYNILFDIFKDIYPFFIGHVFVVTTVFAGVADVIVKLDKFAFPLIVQDVMVQTVPYDSINKLLEIIEGAVTFMETFCYFLENVTYYK